MPPTRGTRLVFVMNCWFSAAGGIQTVNRELACAISAQRPDSINVKGLDIFALAAGHITRQW